jgi:hypothetical protein
VKPIRNRTLLFGILPLFVALVACNSTLPEQTSSEVRALTAPSPTGVWVDSAAPAFLDKSGCPPFPSVNLRLEFGAVAASGAVTGSVTANGNAQSFQGTYDAGTGYLSGTVGNSGLTLGAYARVPNRLRGWLEGAGGCLGSANQSAITGTVRITFYAGRITRTQP